MPTKYLDHTPYVMQMQSVNVKDFGAAVDGATDDTTAFNNAIAALPNGGTVFLPEGTICVSSAIKLTAGITIQGAGIGATIVKMLAAGSKADTFITNIPGSSGGAGGQTNRVAIRDLKIDLTNVTGGTAGAGNGIHFYGANFSNIERVWVYNGSEWGILIDSDSTNTSAHNRISNCVVDTCAGGIYQTASDSDLMIDKTFITGAGTAAADNQGKFSGDTTVYSLRLVGGYAQVGPGCEFGSAGTTTSQAVNIATTSPCRIIGNWFNQTRYAAINIAASSGGHSIDDNDFSNCSAVGTTGILTISSSNNTITSNLFEATFGAAHYTYVAIDGAAVSNAYEANVITSAGSSGTFNQNAGSTNKINVNVGHNPIGVISAPSFPATTVAAVNNTGYDVTAYITNGTAAITQIQIAGQNGTYTNTGMNVGASGWASIRIPSGAGFKATYASGSPSWVWVGD